MISKKKNLNQKLWWLQTTQKLMKSRIQILQSFLFVHKAKRSFAIGQIVRDLNTCQNPNSVSEESQSTYSRCLHFKTQIPHHNETWGYKAIHIHWYFGGSESSFPRWLRRMVCRIVLSFIQNCCLFLNKFTTTPNYNKWNSRTFSKALLDDDSEMLNNFHISSTANSLKV